MAFLISHPFFSKIILYTSTSYLRTASRLVSKLGHFNLLFTFNSINKLTSEIDVQ